MSKEVREAIDLIKYHFACNAPARESNIRTLVEAWLAEHPADDELIVCFDWLKTCKRIYRDEFSDIVIGGELILTHELDGSFTISIRNDNNDDVELLDDVTRGDVRRLCRALRVELGEQR